MAHLLRLAAVGQPRPPDVPSARRELSDELWNPVYARSWWDRFTGWLSDRLLLRSGDVDLSSLFVVALIVLSTIVVAAVAVWWWRRRHAQAAPEETGAVFAGEVVLTADAYRERAAAHEREGRWDDALLDSFRALTAAVVDKGLTADSPDLTAHEVGSLCSRAFPDHAVAAARAAWLFDLVRYGDGDVSRDDARLVADLDRALQDATPRTDGRRDATVVPR